MVPRLRVGGVAVPEAPTAATVTPYSGSDLFVQFTPPAADGGSQVTSYRIDWDTEPGVREVQNLRTTPNLGPNEIQTIQTSAQDIDEVQSFHTRALTIPEVQVVTTYANPLETLGGSFTLAFDDTANGGGLHVSAQIAHHANSSRGATPCSARASCSRACAACCASVVAAMTSRLVVVRCSCRLLADARER